MNVVSKLSNWIKTEIDYLKNNEELSGSYVALNGGPLAVVLCWEPGFDEAVDSSLIQYPRNPSWALCCGIKLIGNTYDPLDEWLLLSTNEGEMVTETFSVNPKENFDSMARGLIEQFKDINRLYDIDPHTGEVSYKTDEVIELDDLDDESPDEVKPNNSDEDEIVTIE